MYRTPKRLLYISNNILFKRCLKHYTTSTNNNNNNTNNNIPQPNTSSNTTIKGEKNKKFYLNENLISNQRNPINKNSIISEKFNSNTTSSTADRLINNTVYVVNNEKEELSKINDKEEDSYTRDKEFYHSNFLNKSRFELPIQIPKITLNSQYRKYAIMIKNNVDLETIKNEASLKDNVFLSTSFYNTLIYVYLLKLNSNSNNNNNNNNNNEESISILENIETIFKYIYKADRITFLLRILSLIKSIDNQVTDNRNIVQKYCEDLIKGPNSYLLCIDGFLMLLQHFYNCKNYEMVVNVYREFVPHHSFLNESETWFSGIIIHSMYRMNVGTDEMELLLKKSGLEYTKYTQFHYNCLATKHLEENGIIEAWSILKQLYIQDLEYSKSIPFRIIKLLKETEQYELTIQMYPLLMSIYKDSNDVNDAYPKQLLKELLSDCGEIGNGLINSNHPIFNPLSDNYIFSKRSIANTIIEPTPSIMGIKIPVVPKHKRVSRYDRIFNRRLDGLLNKRNNTDEEIDFFNSISNNSSK